MTRRNRRPGFNPTPLQILVSLSLAGVVISILAGALLWLLSADTSGLPSAAKDLSTLDSLFLRAFLRWNESTLNTPWSSADGIFEVREGETATEICGRLQSEGWVQSADVTVNYLRYTGGDRSIGSGMFLFRAGMSTRQIADALSSGESKVRVLSVFAGWRMEEIAQAFSASGIPILQADFLSAASGRPGEGSDLELIYAGLPPGATLEGFLYPSAYNILPGETAPDLVARMIRGFAQMVPADLRTAMTTHGLTFYQAVTLASIIQREAVLEEEMPLIASVFYNRLAQNQRLETDPTVQYAIGFQAGRGGWWANPILASDKSVDSPYNTFVYFGLPPGPICNPGLAALKAVAYPASSPYFYFRADCDESGRHRFAETYLQHLANACEGQ